MMNPSVIARTTTGSPTNCARLSEYSEIPALLNEATAWKTAEYIASPALSSYPACQKRMNSTSAKVPSTAMVMRAIAPIRVRSSPMSMAPISAWASIR